MEKKKPSRKITRRPKATTQLLLAIVVFVLSAVLSGNGQIGKFEEQVFLWIYYWPDWLNPFFIVITQLGNFFILVGLAALYAIWRKYHITLRLLLSGSLAYLLAGVAKDLVGRPRPIDLLADISIRDFIVRGAGFPSGHAALAAALAVTIWPHLPKKYRWVAPFILIGVGLSRIYLGVHAPLDVIGGAAIGWASAALFRHVDIRYRQPRKYQ